MSRKRRRNQSKVVIKDKGAFIRSISILIILLIIGILAYSFFTMPKNEYVNTASSENPVAVSENKQEVETEKPKPVEDITFSMAVTGDIMCHNTQYTDAYDATTKTYDFSYVFDDIKYYIQTADIAIGNLETTFAGAERGYTSYPTFNTPEALAYNLKSVGFDMLSTANNHSLDKGYSGLESTINFLDDADLSHTGTFNSEESQNTIIYKNIKGVKIAFLSYTYGTNGIPVPKGKEYCINLIDKDLIKSHIELAKQGEPDLICVSMHWGEEYRTTPTKEQESLVDFLFENGVDIILGNHSHVLEPMEKKTITLEDGTTKDVFVIYSLGNFISGQVKELTKDTAILNLKITKHGDTGNITIDDVNYTPLYMYKGTSKTQAYKLLDINKCIQAYEADSPDKVSTATYNTLVAELKKIQKILDE